MKKKSPIGPSDRGFVGPGVLALFLKKKKRIKKETIPSRQRALPEAGSTDEQGKLRIEVPAIPKVWLLDRVHFGSRPLVSSLL